MCVIFVEIRIIQLHPFLYMLKYLLVLAYCLIATTWLGAQSFDDKPKDDYATPYNALYSYNYYMSPEHYQSQKLNRIFPKGTPNASELALQLKQVLDGKGLQIQLSNVPEDSIYLDSITKKNVYILFDNIPEIYLELDKDGNKWRFARETVQAIPRLHKRVYPLGSDLLLKSLPSFGEDRIFGLAVWQYVGILIIAVGAILLIWLVSRLLNFAIRAIANTKLGTDKFDTKIVFKIARVLSYLLSLYLLYIFIPILQLPIGLGYYVIITLRIATTCFILLFFLRSIDLARSYILTMLARDDEDDTHKSILDEHLTPIVVRTLKVFVLIGGFFHILSILDINVTALVAGLSIGGIAIALAAQETIKNLIGSVMIYADKPFKIGDYINNGSDIEGTVEDIGFRSTRIRTLDTSLIAVPNGKLIDMVVNNLGARQLRRYRTIINIAYHTPPELVEAYVQGLREIIKIHPLTYKDDFYIYLNSMQESGLGILFMIYITTEDWHIELRSREEIILSVMRLAKTLGIQIALPSRNLYIETQPDKPTNLPNYQQLINDSSKNLQQFTRDLRIKFASSEETFEEDEDENPAVPSPS